MNIAHCFVYVCGFYHKLTRENRSSEYYRIRVKYCGELMKWVNTDRNTRSTAEFSTVRDGCLLIVIENSDNRDCSIVQREASVFNKFSKTALPNLSTYVCSRIIGFVDRKRKSLLLVRGWPFICIRVVHQCVSTAPRGKMTILLYSPPEEGGEFKFLPLVFAFLFLIKRFMQF